MHEEENVTEVTKRNWPRRVARIFLKTLLFLFLFIILIFLLILTPPVQRLLTGKVENYLQKKLQTEVNIGRIAFGLSGDIALKDVYIEDKSNDTLVSGGAIKAHLNYLKLFSNELEVKDIELQNIVAKIKRTLPDTTFNYQFIVDAFTSDQSANPDTAQSPPMKLNISDITLDNVALTYKDVITGVDMFGHVGYATTTIDTLNPYTQTYTFPSIIFRNTTVRMKQTKPLLEPKPMSQDLAEAQTPPPLNLSFGEIDLSKVNVQYDNIVSAMNSTIKIGKLKADGKLLDLQHNKVYLDDLTLENTLAELHMGKSQGAEEVKQQTKQEVAAESTAGWDFRVDKINFANNKIIYDDDTQPEQVHGMDYAHLNVNDLDLHANNFILNQDSTYVSITGGSFTEAKSNFVLNELHGDVLYGDNKTYLKDLLIKTPGSEIKRSAVLDYASLDELTNHFERAVMDLNIVNSRLQVKDILTFAPQLRTQPAFSNPSDVWTVNLVGHGTLDRLQVEKLQFDGLQNTHINAAGTLVGLANPANAGGNFNIYQFHSTRSDMALFAGNSLQGTGVTLPQAVDISGTINGNTGHLFTRLNVNSTEGDLYVNGSFANLTSPATMTYDASIRASALQLGRILGMQGQLGSLTGTISANGRGVTPDAINTKFKAAINHVGYNGYAYRNIDVSGSLRKSVFDIHANVNDPNADVTLTASGDYAAYGPFQVNADIDSLKLQNLNLSDQRLVFRGHIEGTADDLNSGSPTANLLLTNALVVTSTNRLPIDSLQVIAGHDNENYIVLKSDIASAEIRGQYNLLQLGDIIQNNLAPYFSSTIVKNVPVDPYDIRFRADLNYSPALQAFVPDLKRADSVFIKGNLSSTDGLDATIAAADVVYQTNELHNLQATVTTDQSGLHLNATTDRLQAAGFNVFKTHINATANQNNINFSVAVNDRQDTLQYLLSGLVQQSKDGNMTLHLNPDSLRLNYDRWTVAPDNKITIGSGGGILANNFSLSRAGQQLSIQSQGNSFDAPLQVRFNDFRLSTLTGFLKPDTTIVDGVTNGTVTFQNIAKQPLMFTSDLNVNNLSFQQDTLGNLAVKVSSSGGETYNTNIALTGNGNDLGVTGTLSPSGDAMALDLELAIRQLRLGTFRGAMQDFVSKVSGSLAGNVSIKGTTASPDISGKINFNDVSVTTTMLGGPFTINNESLIVVDNKGLTFNNFSIRDSANNALTFDGLIGTTNFTDYNFDFNIRARNFMAVNNTKKQNDLFYGKLNISTNLHVGGTGVAPVVDGTLRINDATNFTVVIPQQDQGVVSRKGVVEFVDFSNPANDDSTFMAPYDSLNRSALVGFDVNTNIIVNKDAVFSVVIDEANGDLVNLQGEANLSAGIDPSGKISLTGTYEISNGSYQLSYNFIQRKFEIQKGSTIEWYGEPTAAEMNLTAIYVANTAPLDLVSDYIAASTDAIRNTYLQKLPFQVILNMEGELMQPKLSFNIVLPEDKNYGVSSDIINNVQIRLAQLRQENSELNKQVFSLLLLGRFVGENPFKSSGDGFSAKSYAMQSVSKLLTEQLNNLASNLVAGVDLNFDVTSADDYTTGTRRNRTDLNVGLSKQLLNDRLTVSVGSNFELAGPQTGAARSSNLAGNVAITYKLSRDGRYLLRAYRKNEYFGVLDGYIIETGLRFIITLDYQHFADLFRRKKLRVDNNKKPENKSSE